MQLSVVAKYAYGYATNTNKKLDISYSWNTVNIWLLIPHVQAEIRTQAFTCW